jgi:hypothetical protein
MLFINGNRYGLEFKYTDAPQRDKVTKRGQGGLEIKTCVYRPSRLTILSTQSMGGIPLHSKNERKTSTSYKPS